MKEKAFWIRAIFLSVLFASWLSSAFFYHVVNAGPMEMSPDLQETQNGGTPAASLFLPFLFSYRPSPVPTSQPGTLPAPSPSTDSNPTPGSVPSSVLGVGTYSWSIGISNLPESKGSWVRPEPVMWSAVEPQRGERRWEVLAGLEKELQAAASQGKQVILVVLSAPTWAQLVQGSACGPILPSEYQAFANFLRDLVSRYSTPPYAVHYWEIWNEPDVDPSLVSGDSLYGCWGDQTDWYYGGGRYADLLKVVYPQIKSADPGAQVLVGGLLLGCNPLGGSICPGENAKPGRFLEGILRNGGAAYFDAVSYHAFDAYRGSLGWYGSGGWDSSWTTTGPVLVAKGRFLRDTLNAYGAGDKPLLATEASVFTTEPTCDSNCELTKAYYMPQMIASTMAEGFQASLWYCVSCGWRHVDLFDPSGKPLPAYTAYNVAWNELSGSHFSQKLNLDPNLRVFEFTAGDHTLWVLWAADTGSYRVDLPGRPLKAIDVLGGPVDISRSYLDITIKPIYLEWTS